MKITKTIKFTGLLGFHLLSALGASIETRVRFLEAIVAVLEKEKEERKC